MSIELIYICMCILIATVHYEQKQILEQSFHVQCIHYFIRHFFKDLLLMGMKAMGM